MKYICFLLLFSISIILSISYGLVVKNSKICKTTLLQASSLIINSNKIKNAMITTFISLGIITTPLYIENVYAETIEVARDILADQEGSKQEGRRTITLASGLKYYDEIIGDGAEAIEGKTVQFQWVLRRSNGYFVDSSANYNNEPFIYKIGNLKKAIKGVDEGIRGMKVGGVRRLAIPPKLAYIEGLEDDKPGPKPSDFGPKRQILTRLDKEVWYFEIKLIKVK